MRSFLGPGPSQKAEPDRAFVCAQRRSLRFVRTVQAQNLLGALLLTGTSLCVGCRTSPAQDSSEPVRPAAESARSAPPKRASVDRASEKPREDPRSPKTAAPPNPRPPLPSDLDFDQIVKLDVPGDRKVRVLHAPAPSERALFYFHGMCSSSTPADVWGKEAARYGTLIMLEADVPCGDRPGNKWPKDPASLTARIDRALEAVRAVRNGHLDGEKIALIGYSQGAHRAEVLAGFAPDRYPWLILGGPPEAAIPANFSGAQAVAVLGGDLENTDHMHQGVALLAQKGVRVRFFRLPDAYHGTYGPKGLEVMTEVLGWTFEGAR